MNIYKCLDDHVEKFMADPSCWPSKYKHKSKEYDERNNRPTIFPELLWEYDYKNDDNIVGVNEFYRNMPKKSFLRGKKMEIEIIFFYLVSSYYGDTDTWVDYYEKVVCNM